MKIKLDKIEYITGYKVKKNFVSVGFDWATRAGISYIKTTDKYATINYSFIEFDKMDVKDKYKKMVQTLQMLLTKEDLAVIEDVFIGFNRAGSMELAKYHAFAISECVKKSIDYETISATTCRSKLGIMTTKKAGYGKGLAKRAVADWLEKKLGIDLKGDEDASDAIILALLGILEDLDFRSEAEIKKEKNGKKK